MRNKIINKFIKVPTIISYIFIFLSVHICIINNFLNKFFDIFQNSTIKYRPLYWLVDWQFVLMLLNASEDKSLADHKTKEYKMVYNGIWKSHVVIISKWKRLNAIPWKFCKKWFHLLQNKKAKQIIFRSKYIRCLHRNSIY